MCPHRANWPKTCFSKGFFLTFKVKCHQSPFLCYLMSDFRCSIRDILDYKLHVLRKRISPVFETMPGWQKYIVHFWVYARRYQRFAGLIKKYSKVVLVFSAALLRLIYIAKRTRVLLGRGDRENVPLPHMRQKDPGKSVRWTGTGTLPKSYVRIRGRHRIIGALDGKQTVFNIGALVFYLVLP